MISAAALQLADPRLGLDRRAARQRRGIQRPGHHVLGKLEMGGPGFSDSATLNALRTTSGTISGLETRAFHLTIGRRMRDQVDVLV